MYGATQAVGAVHAAAGLGVFSPAKPIHIIQNIFLV